MANQFKRDAFDSNPENCLLLVKAREYCGGKHFLDLSEEDKNIIRAIVAEERELERQSIAERECEVVTNTTTEQSGESPSSDAALTRLQCHYEALVRKLRFDTSAIRRMKQMYDKGLITPIDNELGQLNEGKRKFRGDIGTRSPRIYEVRTGWDYRIYVSRDGQGLRIHLVGDKGKQAQDRDCDFLRKHFG